MKLIKKIELEIEINLEEIATELAESDDTTQAKFFDDFKRSLDKTCRDKHHLEVQLCEMVDKLSEEGKDLVIALYEFIKIYKT